MSAELAIRTSPTENPLPAEKATPNPLVFFETIFSNMRTKMDVDWDNVAAKAHYKSGAIARIRFNTIIRQLRNPTPNASSGTPRTPSNSPTKKRAPKSRKNSSPRRRQSPQSPSDSERISVSPSEVAKKDDTTTKKVKFVSPSKIIKTKSTGRKMVKNIKVEAEKILSEDAKEKPMDEGVSFNEIDSVPKEEPIDDTNISFRGVEVMDFEESDVPMSQ